MKSLEQLLSSHCHEMNGPAMSDADVRAQLAVLDGWAVDDGALTKTYRFKNYYETLAFVNALAYIVHREDHHPDLHVGYNRCVVRYNTHSINGISQNDFISAAKADALYSQTDA
ncbi:MAG TPA: 4a-hydroxytetrahydrobiopterin dehydratase [Burkholderiaceae bacterium]|jgi:4a-hydroxytetrahydrobiopterin dehydratase|nr:4a-hydroxytetrahydrobiopterin dehydratase [Burkholderiaceae bacterium]